MPIFDNDGTTNRQVGKVYDFDGTTNRQIGKVYDFDGTTHHLIYTAEENVLAGGVNYYNGVAYVCNGSMTSNSAEVRMTLTYRYGEMGGLINAYTKIPYDLSGVDTLSFTVSGTGDAVVLENTAVYVGVVTTMPTANGSWAPSGWQHAGVPNGMRVINAKEVAAKPVTTTAKTYTLDVSSLSGAHYITLCGANNYGYYQTGSTANVTITNVTLS